ncbi:MAG TPA: hypothetical protein PLL15_05840 [Syntrophales bacterium]|jgi:hypothetical protein|nr:hypothetical protein [Syntrophales bacterium]
MGLEHLIDVYNPLAKERQTPIHGDETSPDAGLPSGRGPEGRFPTGPGNAGIRLCCPDGKIYGPDGDRVSGVPDTTDVPAPPIQSWQDSGPICRLSEYLKANDGHGIRVVLRHGIPALRFEPGLRRSDTQSRWQTACQAESLFWSAFEDLRFCITNNLISLKEK